MIANFRLNKRLIKISISVLILIYLFFKIDISAFLLNLSKVNFLYFGLALFVVLLGLLISSLKLSIIFNQFGNKSNFFLFFLIYHTSMFFNSFLPSTIGGDAFKIHSLAKTSSYSKSIMSVLFDRLSGVLALISFAFVGLTATGSLQHIFYFILLSILLVLLLLFVLRTRLKSFFLRVIPKNIDMINLIRSNWNLLLILLKDRGFLFVIFLLSVLFQLCTILAVFLVSLSLDISVPFLYLLKIVPLINLILLLPISINGLGLRESAYIFFLGYVNINAEQAVSVSFLIYILLTLVNISGFISFNLLNSFESKNEN